MYVSYPTALQDHIPGHTPTTGTQFKSLSKRGKEDRRGELERQIQRSTKTLTVLLVLSILVEDLLVDRVVLFFIGACRFSPL